MNVHPLNVLDAAILLIMGWNVLRGFNKGFVEEILSIIGIIASIILALRLSHPLASLMSVMGSVEVVAIGFVVYLISFLIFKYFAYYINAKFAKSNLGVANNILGFLFGIVRGAILSAFFVLFLGSVMPNSYLIKKSYLGGFLVPVSDKLIVYFPRTDLTKEANDNWNLARQFLIANRKAWRGEISPRKN